MIKTASSGIGKGGYKVASGTEDGGHQPFKRLRKLSKTVRNGLRDGAQQLIDCCRFSMPNGHLRRFSVMGGGPEPIPKKSIETFHSALREIALYIPTNEDLDSEDFAYDILTPMFPSPIPRAILVLAEVICNFRMNQKLEFRVQNLLEKAEMELDRLDSLLSANKRPLIHGSISNSLGSTDSRYQAARFQLLTTSFLTGETIEDQIGSFTEVAFARYTYSSQPNFSKFLSFRDETLSQFLPVSIDLDGDRCGSSARCLPDQIKTKKSDYD